MKTLKILAGYLNSVPVSEDHVTTGVQNLCSHAVFDVGCAGAGPLVPHWAVLYSWIR